MIQVQVCTDVNPTESRDKVHSALVSIFPDLDFEFEELSEYSGRFSGEGDIHILKYMHYLIREEEIIDTSRTRLNVGMSEDMLSTSFIISKQVATVGRLNYPAQEEPLGSIRITVKADSVEELERFYDWLTPPTEDGVPDFEMDIRDV
ncbi:RNA-binding domain-containing protein [Methanolobus psychrotolerans]|uniref:RNA-binding domain-containing protein n=1 Tax=Methanolobus psychrotolerans TaxID=1874706 RepID=UPI000B91C1E7|nr:RNA-binding domain-containing protein [Methanolobus psychrotolerans]